MSLRKSLTSSSGSETSSENFTEITGQEAQNLLKKLPHILAPFKKEAHQQHHHQISLRENRTWVDTEDIMQTPNLFWLCLEWEDEKTKTKNLTVLYSKWQEQEEILDWVSAEKTFTEKDYLDPHFDAFLAEAGFPEVSKITPENLINFIVPREYHFCDPSKLYFVEMLIKEGKLSDAKTCFDLIKRDQLPNFLVADYDTGCTTLAESFYSLTNSADRTIYANTRDHAKLVFVYLKKATELKPDQAHLLLRTFKCMCRGDYFDLDNTIPGLVLPPGETSMIQFLKKGDLSTLLALADSICHANQEITSLRAQVSALRTQTQNLQQQAQIAITESPTLFGKKGHGRT